MVCVVALSLSLSLAEAAAREKASLGSEVAVAKAAAEEAEAAAAAIEQALRAELAATGRGETKNGRPKHAPLQLTRAPADKKTPRSDVFLRASRARRREGQAAERGG
eukprot:SAG25_NODE_719_length_5744_cov_4.938884_3_plen_107_part_00